MRKVAALRTQVLLILWIVFGSLKEKLSNYNTRKHLQLAPGGRLRQNDLGWIGFCITENEFEKCVYEAVSDFGVARFQLWDED